MDGRKRSSSFAITFNHVEWDKTCFGEWLLAGELAKRICICEESHHPPLDPLTGLLPDGEAGRHHHVFVEFIDKYFLTEVRDICIRFLGDEEDRSINIQVNIFLTI